jgi:hypothetical protein
MPPLQRGIQRILPQIIATESIFSVVVMAICLAIYFKTEELEKLSQHKGIKYFRKTFLFFAISYLFKFITRTLAFGISPVNGISLLEVVPSAISFSISIYASVMAFFYFVYSISSKERDKYLEYIWHIIALATGVLTVLFSDVSMFIAIQLVLLAYAVYKMLSSEKKTKFYILYVLLLIVWLLSIIEIFVPDLLFNIQMMIYLSSGLLFSIILLRVLKSTRV